MTQPGGSGLRISLWLGAVLAGCSLSFIGVAALAPRVVADLRLPAESVGFFSGTVWAAALGASLASVALVARWGAWPVTRASLLACAAGLLCLAAGWSPGFWLGAVLIGIGQGLEAPPASQSLGHHVAPQRRPWFFSVKQTGVQFGAVMASLLLPALTPWLGWQGSLALVATVLLLLATVLVRPAHAFPMPATAGPQRPVLAVMRAWLKLLVEDRGLLRLGLAAAAFGATQVCMNSFLVTWAVGTREASLQTAGALAAAAQAAGMLGRPVWGWLASRSGSSQRVLIGLGLVMAACSAVLGLAGAALPMGWLVVLVTCFGLTASGWNGVFLAEVAGRVGNARIADATAAAMVPLYAGLIAGPVAFAALGHWAGLSSGFLMTAGIALAGTLMLRGLRRQVSD